MRPSVPSSLEKSSRTVARARHLSWTTSTGLSLRSEAVKEVSKTSSTNRIRNCFMPETHFQAKRCAGKSESCGNSPRQTCSLARIERWRILGLVRLLDLEQE